MVKTALALLAGTLLSTSAYALDACKVSDQDPQTRICIYSPEQRYIVQGVVGYPVNLNFGETEQIKREDFAFTGLTDKGMPTETWRGPPKKSGSDDTAIVKDRFKTNLPIWPGQDGQSSLIVVTQLPNGDERTYQFVLLARKPGNCATDNHAPGCLADTTTTAQLSFVYPADKAAEASQDAANKHAAAVAAWQGQQAKRKEAIAIARLKTDIFYGPRNWRYQAKADPKYKFLAPSEVSDNGWLTEFQWPSNVQQPTITIVDPVTGEERAATVTQQDRMQIVNGTAQHFRLRLGRDAVMDIDNLGWHAERPDPGTGTTSPDVVRTVIYRDGQHQ